MRILDKNRLRAAARVRKGSNVPRTTAASQETDGTPGAVKVARPV